MTYSVQMVSDGVTYINTKFHKVLHKHSSNIKVTT
jgi:hypothetical protein